MSLRAFHIVLIASTIGLLAFLLCWSGARYAQQGVAQYLPLSFASALGLLIAVPYLKWFVEKGSSASR